MWQFSESSQSLLKRYAETAEENHRNKWVKKLGSNTNKLLEMYNFADIVKEIPSFSLTDSDESTVQLIQNENTDEGRESQPVDICFSQDITEIDPVAQIDYLTEKCLNNPNNFYILANNLSSASIEKVCNHILNSNLNQTFTEKFFTIIFPVYLKKETSRTSIELLIKTKSHYIFNSVIEIIIKDMDISSNILQEFVINLTNDEKTELLKTFILFDISPEVFMHNLNVFLLIYKSSSKTTEINSYMLTKLLQTVQLGTNNKNYGQLLHIYLQNQTKNPGDIITLEMLIENHQSPFRKPCLNVLNQIKSQSEE